MQFTSELRTELHEVLRSDELAAHNILFAIECGVLDGRKWFRPDGRCCVYGAVGGSESGAKSHPIRQSGRFQHPKYIIRTRLEEWLGTLETAADACHRNEASRHIRSEVVAWLAENGSHPEPSFSGSLEGATP